MTDKELYELGHHDGLNDFKQNPTFHSNYQYSQGYDGGAKTRKDLDK